MLAEAEVPGLVVVERVAALLRLEPQHEGAVRVDVDGGDRIHLNGDGEAHGAAL